MSHEIETIAYYIFRQKIIDQLNIMLADAWKMAEEQVGRDAFENWVHGRIYFAHDLLYYGKNWTDNVKDGFFAGLFGQLGDTWLQDVITLEAYLIWRKKMKGFQSNEAERRADYLEAVDAFETRLNSAERVEIPKIKERMRKYLTVRYLSPELKLADEKDEFNVKRVNIHTMAESKAKRMYEITGKSDALANYYEAYGYIRTFYEGMFQPLRTRARRVLTQGKVCAMNL